MEEDSFMSSLEERFPSFVEFDENSGLIILSHESRRYDNKLILLGQIKNNGQETWSNIHIEVDLFNSKNAFVDQCSDLIWGDIRPEQTRNFKVTCGECDDDPPVEFETYEIKILDATHER